MEDPEKFIETDDKVGMYVLGGLLGEGQFATVHACHKLSSADLADPGQTDGRDYALKIIKKERIMNFMGLKRMSNEIETLRKLDSKYIICLHEVLQSDSKLYIVTEKGGPDLFEFFDEHPDGVPEIWAKEIMYRILRAVQYCHEHGYCHRDLKPEVITPNLNEELLC
jgi:serine/threonine protein kinase